MEIYSCVLVIIILIYMSYGNNNDLTVAASRLEDTCRPESLLAVRCMHDLHARREARGGVVHYILNPCHVTKLMRTSHGNNKKVNSSLCSTCGAAQVSEHGIKHTQGRASSTRLPFVNKKKKLRMHCMCFHGMQGKQETGRNSQIIALRTLKQWQN